MYGYTHILTADTDNSYGYCDFTDTQLNNFILKHGENVVEYSLHKVMILISKYN
ncbi:hypothetical protein [Clostridioides sp. ZZV14-6387]|uniref:hypothetical protein n=1 Tax=Clostridioides sp. ZZV14-6387 TaxID=2811497 RepID=UPI001D0F7298